MAIIRRRAVSLAVPNGEAYADVEIDDVALEVKGFYVKNDGPGRVLFECVRESDGKVWGGKVDPTEERFISLGQGAQNRLEVVLVPPRGGIGGYVFRAAYPVS